MQENQSPKKTLPIEERIEAEASRRAAQKAEDFDLLSCTPFAGLEWSGDEGFRISSPRGRGIYINLNELNSYLREFLEDHLPVKLAERMRQQLLAGPMPEIDVTQLEDSPPTSNP